MSRSSDLPHGDGPLVIVCAYEDGMLASPWFRAYRQVKRELNRRGLNIRVELAPVSDLPLDVDILAVLPSLAEAGLTARAASEHLVTLPDGLRQALDTVLDRLVRDGRLDSGPAPDQARAIHRGFQPLAERARPDAP